MSNIFSNLVNSVIGTVHDAISPREDSTDANKTAASAQSGQHTKTSSGKGKGRKTTNKEPYRCRSFGNGFNSDAAERGEKGSTGEGLQAKTPVPNNPPAASTPQDPPAEAESAPVAEPVAEAQDSALADAESSNNQAKEPTQEELVQDTEVIPEESASSAELPPPEEPVSTDADSSANPVQTEETPATPPEESDDSGSLARKVNDVAAKLRQQRIDGISERCNIVINEDDAHVLPVSTAVIFKFGGIMMQVDELLDALITNSCEPTLDLLKMIPCEVYYVTMNTRVVTTYAKVSDRGYANEISRNFWRKIEKWFDETHESKETIAEAVKKAKQKHEDLLKKYAKPGEVPPTDVTEDFISSTEPEPQPANSQASTIEPDIQSGSSVTEKQSSASSVDVANNTAGNRTSTSKRSTVPSGNPVFGSNR